MTSVLDDKTILLTGGTGSFGQKFTEYVLNNHTPKSIRIYSRSEFTQFQMARKFNDDRIRFLIGDVRDEKRLFRAMNGVDIVIHAAALKQVPACEYNPIEAVKTNIDGAVNIINAAIDNRVGCVLALSTDKAVHPVNLYGATKMVAEKLFIQGNSYTGYSNTRFSCVRYGNVMGSRGSVIPLFIEQAQTGTITITDERMTRFWLTLEEGVLFVIQSVGKMKGGEIFVPKIPSMKVADLAVAIAPDANIELIGIRAGEKLHEVLITEDEARHAKEYEDHYIIEPDLPFWSFESDVKGKLLIDDFRYTSEINDWWLTGEELKKMI